MEITLQTWYMISIVFITKIFCEKLKTLARQREWILFYILNNFCIIYSQLTVPKFGQKYITTSHFILNT